MFPAHWFRLLQIVGTLATLFGDEFFLTTPSPATFLRFPRRNQPLPVSSAANCLNFAAMVTAFSCPLTYAGYNGRRILLAAPADTLCRIQLISSWIILHLSLSGVPSLALLLPFLTSSPDLGVWHHCWVSVEELHGLLVQY